ncbi:permease prefix domain 1-containing protein [Actinomadura kijaniata]|uniref:permease prefix domain 1-containing protein n=1 Tax=Actinomadura kijaniata TaxID=46161 RepID=UPI003F1C3262
MTAPAIEEHVTALASALRGPARVRDRMVREARDGLVDAADALAAEGLPGDEAARLAVRDFGAVAEVVPDFQRELAVAQARRTAGTVALVVPFLVACWTMVGDPGRGTPSLVAGLLALYAGGVAVVTAVLAAAALAATGTVARRLPDPHRLPELVAWTGTTAGAALGVGALAVTVSSLLTADWRPAALTGVLTLVSHARVAASARACRTCARLAP